MRMLLPRSVCALLLLSGLALSAEPIDAGRYEEWARLVRPATDEASWEKVPWMSATNIWAARQKAAAEQKPLLLWYMAGEPLGVC